MYLCCSFKTILPPTSWFSPSFRQNLHSRKIWWSLWPQPSCPRPWRQQPRCPPHCHCHPGLPPRSSRRQPYLLLSWGQAMGPSAPRLPPSSLLPTKSASPELVEASSRNVEKKSQKDSAIQAFCVAVPTPSHKMWARPQRTTLTRFKRAFRASSWHLGIPAAQALSPYSLPLPCPIQSVYLRYLDSCDCIGRGKKKQKTDIYHSLTIFPWVWSGLEQCGIFSWQTWKAGSSSHVVNNSGIKLGTF